MSSKSKVLITTDDYAFVIFDLETNTITYKKEKIGELDCPHLIGHGLEGEGRSTFRPFGIAVDEHIYIASNDKLGKFNHDYEFQSLIDVPMSLNTHQILKDGNMVYACNTSVNNIGIYDLNTGINKFLDLNTFTIVDSFEQPEHVDTHDLNHVNSLFDDGDKVWFCLHNGGKKTSQHGYFDKKTYEVKIVVEAGLCAHNIIIEDNDFYTLSTRTGEFVHVDLQTNQHDRYKIVDDGIFMRGLDRWQDKFIIGGSVNFKASDSKSSCLLILDLKTKQLQTFVLDGIKFINDLKVI